MTSTAETLAHLTPSAIASDAELNAWQSLPRDEQLRRLQEKLKHSDCATVSNATMSDIRNRAQAAAQSRHG